MYMYMYMIPITKLLSWILWLCPSEPWTPSEFCTRRISSHGRRGEESRRFFVGFSVLNLTYNLCLESLEKQVASHPCVSRSEVSQLQGSMVVSCAMVRGPWPPGVVLVGTSLPSATASTSSVAMTQSVEPWSARCRDSLPEVDMLSALRSRRLWEVLTRRWFGEV